MYAIKHIRCTHIHLHDMQIIGPTLANLIIINTPRRNPIHSLFHFVLCIKRKIFARFTIHCMPKRSIATVRIRKTLRIISTSIVFTSFLLSISLTLFLEFILFTPFQCIWLGIFKYCMCKRHSITGQCHETEITSHVYCYLLVCKEFFFFAVCKFVCWWAQYVSVILLRYE